MRNNPNPRIPLNTRKFGFWCIRCISHREHFMITLWSLNELGQQANDHSPEPLQFQTAITSSFQLRFWRSLYPWKGGEKLYTSNNLSSPQNLPNNNTKFIKSSKFHFIDLPPWLHDTTQTPGSLQLYYLYLNGFGSLFSKGPKPYDNLSLGHSPELGKQFRTGRYIWSLGLLDCKFGP